MRHSETLLYEAEFPGRDFLDEPRFSGGKDILRNQEDINYGQNSRKNG